MSENTEIVEGSVVGEVQVQEPAPLPQVIKTRRGTMRLEAVEVVHIERFLENLARTGLFYEAANYAGLSYFTVNRLRKADDEFAEMVNEAMEAYRDSLVRAAHSRAVDGWDEPVFSQKLGTQIGSIKRFDSRLLELMLKRHMPEFREKFEGEIKVSGGVLVAPVAPLDPAAWAAQFAGERLRQYSDEPQPQLPPANPDGGNTPANPPANDEAPQ